MQYNTITQAEQDEMIDALEIIYFLRKRNTSCDAICAVLDDLYGHRHHWSVLSDFAVIQKNNRLIWTGKAL